MKVGSIDQAGFSHSQSGFFDDNILCATCDGALGKLDDYAITFCRTYEARKQPLGRDMWLVRDVDTDTLVRFAVSVFWRYSISMRPEANRIDLGPFSAKFEKILFAAEPVVPEPALVIWANQSTFNIKKIAFVPTMHRMDSLRFCAMLLGGLTFVLKIDGRPMPSHLRRLAINGKLDIVIGYKDFDNSYEFNEMKKIVGNMSLPRQRPRRR